MPSETSGIPIGLNFLKYLGTAALFNNGTGYPNLFNILTGYGVAGWGSPKHRYLSLKIKDL